MSVRRILLHNPPPSYSQANATEESTFCEAFVDAFRDPVLVLITLATAIGSFCLLSGLILLCVVSKTLNDQTSEAILLMGMGFFVSAVACITWKLTNRSRIKQMLDAIKEEAV